MLFQHEAAQFLYSLNETCIALDDNGEQRVTSPPTTSTSTTSSQNAHDDEILTS